MEWTVEDRAYALAWEEFSRLKCSGCGYSLEETTAKENQFSYSGEIMRCHACAAQSRTVEKFVHEGGDQAGIMFRMTERPK